MILTSAVLGALLLPLVDGGSFRGAPGVRAAAGGAARALSAPEGPAGYCNWGPAGDAASSTCELKPGGVHVQGGDYCGASQSNCESGCGGNWCTNDSTRMLYCGLPGRCGDQGGDAVLASATLRTADVRCCTENSSLRWPYKCRTIPGVFGESNLPICHSEKTFSEAAGVCASFTGGRLCSGAEMFDKCTRGTGCGTNSKLVWGCAMNGETCAANAECCGGFCDGGVCGDYAGTPAPTDAPTSKPTDVPGSNLVLNPGFEDGLANWYANSGTAEIVSFSHSGAQSVLMRDRTETWMGPQQTMDGRIQANTSYRVSCWAKLRNAEIATLKLTMRIEDDNGPHWNGIWGSINNNGWTLVEGEIFVDVAGSLIGVEFFAEGPAPGVEFWADDFSVVLAGTPAPTDAPTAKPTNVPTNQPTDAPTPRPTTSNPTNAPTNQPTNAPTNRPTDAPTPRPTTPAPTNAPTDQPTNAPTNQPTDAPTPRPTTPEPTDAPTNQPTSPPTNQPSKKPTGAPTDQPTGNPTDQPSKKPTSLPTDQPSKKPTGAPTNQPTGNPTAGPTNKPSGSPTKSPTPAPTSSPSLRPTKAPTGRPTTKSPTSNPTSSPSLRPTKNPTNAPTPVPTNSPSRNPVAGPTFDYGNGPFVTLSTSSEIVTIPRPPVPSSGEPRTDCPHLESGLLSWHDSDTWGGSLPSAGQDVTLPANSKVIIAYSVAEELGVITVPSTSELIFDEDALAPIALDVAGIDVRGALRAGSETCPYATELTITLHGSRPSDLDVFGRSPVATPTYKGISVDGGVIGLHGKRHWPTWTRLAETVSAGQSYLLTQERVDWEVGQEIVLVTTAIHDSKGWHRNEVLTVSSVVADPVPGAGSAVHFATPAAHDHVANGGYQAEVGLLTRNIKVQGAPDDSEPTDPDPGNCQGNWHHGTRYQPCAYTDTTGFGGHIMVHNGGKGYVEGVELYRMGQTNVLGRYPFHWHLLGDSCPDCYFKSNSVHRSFYRCISIHGTNGATVSENVGYDITGYCYYLEDGVEEDNTISFNLAAHVHPVSNVLADGPGGQTIPVFSQNADLINPADATASGYYITNLANDVVGNAASGGWAGFALPVLRAPIGPSRDVDVVPGDRLTKTFDGNTAHSAGWWWVHAGAFYSGGSLYYPGGGDLLEYNAGRDQQNGRREPCLVEGREWCGEGERAWYRVTNSKVFLTPAAGLNSWSGRMEIVHFEAHDVALGLEALESGFAIDDLLVECRSGEAWVMPGTPRYTSADGFFWYDTNQEHIVTRATFRNCGARNSDNVYDSSPTRGCDRNDVNGCGSGSTVWGLLTHSDQFTPEIMQATREIAYENCGRRFKLADFADQNLISSVSGRIQNWADVDGTASGLGEPTLIGSGLTDAGRWWRVDDAVVDDPEGPLTFIKKNDGPERGLGHIRLRWNDALHNSVGVSSCFNGPKGTASSPLCPAIGRIRHIGPLFGSANDPTGGLPVTANAEVAGLVGGFGWVLQLDDGPPKDLRIDHIEVDSSTPLVLAIPYPAGTSFSIVANAAYCYATTTHDCEEAFTAVDSVALVRQSQGNTYFYDSTTQLLYVRIIQFPQTYAGDDLQSPTAEWHVWTLDDLDTRTYGNVHALDRFSFNGITLPKFTYGPYLQISADCSEGISGHCATIPAYVEPEVCPPGYVQVSYDKCCASAGSTDCYASTPAPTPSPTPAPTFGQFSNLVLNPGFEDGMANWYANSGTAQIDSTEQHSGAQSVLMTDRTATWMGPQQTMDGRIQPNTNYRVSCWAKLRNAGSANLKLTMRIEDDNGPHWRGINGAINNNSWTFVEGAIFVDVTGSLIGVDFFAEGPATGVEYWVDDCSVALA